MGKLTSAINQLLGQITILSIATTIATKTTAQTPSLITIGKEAALTHTTNVQVWSGRSTVIDFTKTNEIITYILLADPSRAVISTDAEISSNRAKTVFLKVIQPLQFPGATTTFITNLSVKTRSSDGEEQLYTFNIVPNYGPITNNGVAISPISPGIEQKMLVAGNRVANLSDIELGLRIAINKGFTEQNDPIVFKVREFLALARNSMPLAKAAERVGVSLSVITALGEIGIERINENEQEFRAPMPEPSTSPNDPDSPVFPRQTRIPTSTTKQR